MLCASLHKLLQFTKSQLNVKSIYYCSQRNLFLLEGGVFMYVCGSSAGQLGHKSHNVLHAHLSSWAPHPYFVSVHKELVDAPTL